MAYDDYWETWLNTGNYAPTTGPDYSGYQFTMPQAGDLLRSSGPPPDASRYQFTMPQAGDLLRWSPASTGQGLLQQYPGLGQIGAGAGGGGYRLPDTPLPALRSNVTRNPYQAALQGNPTPSPGQPRGFGSSVLEMVKKNPGALLALLGAGGAGLAGAVKGSDTVKLPKQLDPLAARASANPMDDPNAQARYTQMRQELDRQMRRDIGPGWETSTPGIQALQKLNEAINADQYSRSQGGQQQATQALQTLGGLYGTQQTRKSQEEQNLFALASTLGVLGLGGLSGYYSR